MQWQASTNVFVKNPFWKFRSWAEFNEHNYNEKYSKSQMIVIPVYRCLHWHECQQLHQELFVRCVCVKFVVEHSFVLVYLLVTVLFLLAILCGLPLTPLMLNRGAESVKIMRCFEDRCHRLRHAHCVPKVKRLNEESVPTVAQIDPDVGKVLCMRYTFDWFQNVTKISNSFEYSNEGENTRRLSLSFLFFRVRQRKKATLYFPTPW